MTMRLEDGSLPELRPDGSLLHLLKFEDGSQKMLAAYVVWLCFLECWQQHNEQLQLAVVQSWVAALLSIPTVSRASEASNDAMMSSLSKIIKQNTDAKAASNYRAFSM